MLVFLKTISTLKLIPYIISHIGQFKAGASPRGGGQFGRQMYPGGMSHSGFPFYPGTPGQMSSQGSEGWLLS